MEVKSKCLADIEAPLSSQHRGIAAGVVWQLHEGGALIAQMLQRVHGSEVATQAQLYLLTLDERRGGPALGWDDDLERCQNNQSGG